MGVSKNRGGYPQIINSNRVFPYKPSILGNHYFWKHPYHLQNLRLFQQIELEHTPKKPCTNNRLSVGIPFIVGEWMTAVGACDIGVVL